MHHSWGSLLWLSLHGWLSHKSWGSLSLLISSLTLLSHVLLWSSHSTHLSWWSSHLRWHSHGSLPSEVGVLHARWLHKLWHHHMLGHHTWELSRKTWRTSLMRSISSSHHIVLHEWSESHVISAHSSVHILFSLGFSCGSWSKSTYKTISFEESFDFFGFFDGSVFIFEVIYTFQSIVFIFKYYSCKIGCIRLHHRFWSSNSNGLNFTIFGKCFCQCFFINFFFE